MVNNLETIGLHANIVNNDIERSLLIVNGSSPSGRLRTVPNTNLHSHRSHLTILETVTWELGQLAIWIRRRICIVIWQDSSHLIVDEPCDIHAGPYDADFYLLLCRADGHIMIHNSGIVRDGLYEKV